MSINNEKIMLKLCDQQICNFVYRNVKAMLHLFRCTHTLFSHARSPLTTGKTIPADMQTQTCPNLYRQVSMWVEPYSHSMHIVHHRFSNVNMFIQEIVINTNIWDLWSNTVCDHNKTTEAWYKLYLKKSFVINLISNSGNHILLTLKFVCLF